MSSTLDRFLLLADLKRSANEHTPKALQRMTAKAFEKAFGELEPESRMANELHSGFNMSEASSVSEPEPESIKFARLMIGSLSYDLASGPEHIKAREAACVVLVGLVALKEDDEDPGPDKSLRDPTLPSPDNPSSDRVNRANINPHIALTQVAELNGLSPPLAELCRDVAEGRIPTTSEDLICKMGAALDGTLTGAARDKATGASKSSSSTSKKKRGRPTDTDSHAADRRIYEAWQTHQYKTHKELAREKGMDERAIMLALHRHRARLNRGTTPP